MSVLEAVADRQCWNRILKSEKYVWFLNGKIWWLKSRKRNQFWRRRSGFLFVKIIDCEFGASDWFSNAGKFGLWKILNWARWRFRRRFLFGRCFGRTRRNLFIKNVIDGGLLARNAANDVVNHWNNGRLFRIQDFKIACHTLLEKKVYP